MSRQLFTITFPVAGPDAVRWLDGVRAEHDRDFAGRVGPHFTLVFGSNSISETAYLDHVRQVAAVHTGFPFVCRRTAIGTDHQNDTGYVFLVPDEGNSDIRKLRDRLHSGPFEPLLRLDIPYIPHMTLGRFASIASAKRTCDSLNAQDILIPGRIDALTVVAMEESGLIREIAAFPLTRD